MKRLPETKTLELKLTSTLTFTVQVTGARVTALVAASDPRIVFEGADKPLRFGGAYIAPGQISEEDQQRILTTLQAHANDRAAAAIDEVG